jgi:hypothetical protein
VVSMSATVGASRADDDDPNAGPGSPFDPQRGDRHAVSGATGAVTGDRPIRVGSPMAGVK